VARAIARSPIPVISAVGHETDFTIADFTADLRAATPSAAAEMVVPRRADLREAIESLRLRLIRRRQGDADRLRGRVAELAGRLRDPRRRLAEVRIALDDALERMRIRLNHLQKVRRRDWVHLAVRLGHQSPRGRIAEGLRLVDALGNRLQASWQRRSEQRSNRLQALLALLDSLSPLAVLTRGYRITRRLPEGTIIRQVQDIPVGQRIAVRLAAGSLQATVTEIFKEGPHGQGEV
jgi:exodeoxyribonuclease VII large subunit